MNNMAIDAILLKAMVNLLADLAGAERGPVYGDRVRVRGIGAVDRMVDELRSRAQTIRELGNQPPTEGR